MAAVAVLAAAFCVVSAVFFVWPAHDGPERANAVLSLDGPGERQRERTAVQLVEHGYAKVLLFSQGSYGSTPCPVVPGAQVVCFVPVPGRTVGEVEFAARYAKQHGWHSLILVPGHTQTTRARLLMERCFPGRVIMVPAPLRLVELPYDVLYEWGATAKALFIDRSC